MRVVTARASWRSRGARWRWGLGNRGRGEWGGSSLTDGKGSSSHLLVVVVVVVGDPGPLVDQRRAVVQYGICGMAQRPSSDRVVRER